MLIAYNEALEVICKEFSELTLSTKMIDSPKSTNEILAEDIFSNMDVPSFDDSSMDGYAVKLGKRTSWMIVGEISAGKKTDLTISNGEAMIITTGAQIPAGTDTIIKIEDSVVNDNILSIRNGCKIQKGMYIRYKGEYLKKGEQALSKFTRISSKNIGVLVSFGVSKVRVFNKLKIGVIATGDELVDISDNTYEGESRASNLYSLLSAIKESGHIGIMLGISKDNTTSFKQIFRKGIKQGCDIIISTGGVSVGKYDIVKNVFEELGVAKKFWRVNIKPGKPIYFGSHINGNKKCLVFGLPGNPVSALVAWHIFIKLGIELLFQQSGTEVFFAELGNNIRIEDKRKHFLLANAKYLNNKWIVTSNNTHSSGNYIDFVNANCLIISSENSNDLQIGDIVKCMKI